MTILTDAQKLRLTKQYFYHSPVDYGDFTLSQVSGGSQFVKDFAGAEAEVDLVNYLSLLEPQQLPYYMIGLWDGATGKFVWHKAAPKWLRERTEI